MDYVRELKDDLGELSEKLAAVTAERDKAVRMQAADVERLKACEHIACGDEGWEALRNECPSTAAVAALRDRCNSLERVADDWRDSCERVQVRLQVMSEELRLIKNQLGLA